MTHFDDFLLRMPVRDLRRYWQASAVGLPYQKALMRWLLAQRPAVEHAFLCEAFGVACTLVVRTPTESPQYWRVAYADASTKAHYALAQADSWQDANALAVQQLKLVERYFANQA